MANPYFTIGKVSNKEFFKSEVSETPSLLKITIKLVEPTSKPFRPGQFCTFRVAEGIFRAYSIASDYKNFEEYEFLVSCGHEGVGSNFFKNLQIGDRVNFLGPNGHFKVQLPIAEEVFFLATGTGIAPFIPMIEFLLDNNCSSKIHLIHGFRNEANLDFYKTLHDDLKIRCPNFFSKIYISKPETSTNGYTKGRITDEIKSMNLEKFTNAQFYLCGHPDMIGEVSDLLINADIPHENIILEAFTSPGAYEKIS